jgi:hypothetical protein
LKEKQREVDVAFSASLGQDLTACQTRPLIGAKIFS